jgi:hypothetical protein
MSWMLIAMPGMTAMRPAAPARSAMAVMSRPATPAPVQVISVLLAVYCLTASIPWLARAIGPGPRVKDPVSASQGMMSAAMAVMLFAAL